MSDKDSEALIVAIQDGEQNEWVERYVKRRIFEEIETIARRWQFKDWSLLTDVVADAKALPIQRVLGAAQVVTDWLREQKVSS